MSVFKLGNCDKLLFSQPLKLSRKNPGESAFLLDKRETKHTNHYILKALKDLRYIIITSNLADSLDINNKIVGWS